MKEILGNIWDFHAQGNWIVITTNGVVKRDGSAVMGRGVAEQAKARFPDLAFALGKKLTRSGNHVWTFSKFKIVTFPVKQVWQKPAHLDLIRQSCLELNSLFSAINIEPLYIVRPGCGNGQLAWSEVRPILISHIDPKHDLTVVNNESG